MEAILYSPPVLFVIIFLVLIAVSKWLSRFSNKTELGKHALDAYACGQRDVKNYVNPDYSQYYSYAMIFTVAHILVLVVATAPADAQILPVAYIVTGILTVIIALKR